ncbi:MAG: large conductance mechanosensitive channel protein MscL [Synergistaceae bacterium]|jgi:large conductance mechanosensitive channel|nr:large conductance mechanosensitive channel protein MscL [Synergistaceae bacterium]
MSVMQDFKKFAMRGNVLDMAVGVIIGAAFGKVIASLVTDILMPPIGLALGGVDFSNLFINLSETPAATLAEAVEAGLPVISYGLFINSIINFLIQAWAIFWVIRFANKMSKPEPTPAPKRKCPFCLSDIDDNATRCPNCTSQL